MKRLLLILLFLLSFVFVLPQIQAKENVYIESINVEEKSTTSIEENEPVIDGLKIKFDVTFNNLDDYIKYQVVINNNSNTDYEIDTKSMFNGSEYVKYEYQFNNDSNIVKKNSKSIMFIKMTYYKSVPSSLLEDGKFTENNTFNISLSNEKINNPNTGQINYGLILACFIIIIISVYRLFFYNKNELTLLLIICLILVPTSFAIEKLQIIVETKITIQKDKNVIEARYSNDINRKIGYNDETFNPDGVYEIEEIDFWKYTDNIENITFNSNDEHLSTYDYKFDVSEKKNKSITAYLVKNGNTCGLETPLPSSTLALSDTNCYDLTIVADGKIYANQDSSFAFADFWRIKSINGIENYDTEYAVNMKAMFYNTNAKYDYNNTMGFNNNSVKRINQDFIVNVNNETEQNYKLNLSHFNTSNVTDMSYMFAENRLIKELDISNFDTSNVTNMSYMFASTLFTTLDLSHFNTSSVTNMSGMFFNSSCLRETDLSYLNTSNVTDMSYMFAENKQEISFDLSHFNTSKVTSMKGMFNDSRFITLNLSSFNTSKVTDMSYMFGFNMNLTELNLSNFDTANVTDMSYMFDNCNNLTSLNVSSFNTSKVTNMFHMFQGCQKLTTLDVSNFNTSNVTNMAGIFSNCLELTSLDVSGFNTDSVTNMEGMFYNCRKLTSIDVTEFNTSKVTNMSGMFRNCYVLTSLDVSGFDTSKVTDMSGMFSGCSSLTSIDVSHFDTSQVTSMFDMFNGCSKMTELYLQSFDTSKVTNMGMMFENDTRLLKIYVGVKWTTENVSRSDRMFYKASNLRNYSVRVVDKTNANTSETGYLDFYEH